VFVTLLPILIRLVMENAGGIFVAQGVLDNLIPHLRLAVFGLAIILFLVVEPEGLNRLWRNVRNYFRYWPFSY
jgi:branched-chain amino acid transport system permease protein